MNFLDIMVGAQQQNVSVGLSEETLAADEAEVKREMDRLQSGIGAQRQAGANVESALDARDEAAHDALQALLLQEESRAQLTMSTYQQNQERLQNRDRVGEQIKQAYGVEMQLDMLRPDLGEMQSNLNHYRDKLNETTNETIDTKNPFKWVVNELVKKPYYQKRVQEQQQQIINTVGTAAKVMVSANNAQAVADSFTATADNSTVVANTRNAIDAAQAASGAQLTTDYFGQRADSFAAKYNIRKDLADQQTQYVRTLADIYTGKRAARAAGSIGSDDLLKALDLYQKLGESNYDPSTIELFAAHGIDMGEATQMGATARGQLRAYITSGLPLVFTQGAKDEAEIGQLLAGGVKAAQHIPDRVQGYFIQQAYAQAAQEMQLLKSLEGTPLNEATEKLNSVRFVKYTRDVMGKIKITGLDFSNALNAPGQYHGIGEVIQDQRGANNRSIAEIFSSSGIQQPGSGLGKDILASTEVQTLIASGAPGGKLAQKIAMLVDQKTETGQPVIPAGKTLTFDEYVKLANGDAREIFGFYEAIRKSVTKKLPYTALGAKPVEVLPEFYGEIIQPGFLGNETRAWHQPVRSVEDVNRFILETEQSKRMYEEYQKRQAIRNERLNPTVPSFK